MTLTTSLKLQVIYAMVGMSFNLVSYLRIKLELEGLTSTSPLSGMMVLSLVMLSAFGACKGYKKLFITINSVLAPLLIYAGVITHFSIISSLSWSSILTSPLVVAVAINSFGVAVMTMGLLALLRTNQTRKS